MRIAPAALAVMLTVPALADVGDQLARITASDAALDDRFGSAVAIDGHLAVVGAIRADEGAPSSGAAYLFDISDPTEPRELSMLIPDDVPESRRFGNAVAIDGNIVVVGASLADDNGVNSGAAYLFDVSDPANPVQIAKLLPDDVHNNAQFGTAVAIEGDLVLVGARWDDLDGLLVFAGSAYLYRASTGQLLSKLVPDNPEARSDFGTSVAISGNIVAIGSPGFRTNRGVAYLFDVSEPTIPTQLARIFPAGRALDRFGNSIALNSDIVIIGRPYDNDADNRSRAGSVEILDVSDPSSPIRLDKLRPRDGRPGDDFGDVLALSGSIAIVGLGNPTPSWRNKAYLFDLSDPTNPIELAVLRPTSGLRQGATDDASRFGFSLAISNRTAIVGASLEDGGLTDSGSAYLFDAGACPADIDGDGDADAEDFFAYLDLFAAGDDRADIDGDGDIDAEDFFAYLDLFVQPCQ